LDQFVFSEELEQEIVEKAFSARVFLSYRKKDISHARQFIKDFYAVPEFQSVAVWYDSFLIGGRIFDDEIKQSISRSDIFALLATPHLSEKNDTGADNYVVAEEYPYAVGLGKPVVAIEAVPTDSAEFRRTFPEGITKYATIEDIGSAFGPLLQKNMRATAADDAERSYLLGMAFLLGVMVERNSAHAEKLLRQAAEAGNLKAIEQLATLSRYRFDYDEALEWYQKAAAVRESMYGDSSESYLRMSQVYYEQGNYAKALEGYEKVMAALGISDDVWSGLSAEIYKNLVAVYNALGNHAKAAEYAEKSLQIKRRLSLDEDPNLYSNYGLTFYESGNYTQAIEWHKKALELRENLFGQMHADTANSYMNLGAAHMSNGDLDVALNCFTKALAIQEQLLGIKHPDTLTTYHNLTGVLIRKEDYSGALELYRTVAGLQEEVLGGNHIETASSYLGIANCLQAMSKKEEALQWFDKALSVFENQLGADHPTPQAMRFARQYYEV
jgi:tetratricopeptide (TPR) repeat protein